MLLVFMLSNLTQLDVDSAISDDVMYRYLMDSSSTVEPLQVIACY